MRPLRDASDRAAQSLAGRYPAVRLLWTGEIPLNLDVVLSVFGKTPARPSAGRC